MIIVLVNARVKPEGVAAFRQATLANVEHSRKEPGVARFNAIQQQDDPTRFVLIEHFRTPEAASAHKETAHYKAWRDQVEPLMAEPRVGVRYVDVSS